MEFANYAQNLTAPPWYIFEENKSGRELNEMIDQLRNQNWSGQFFAGRNNENVEVVNSACNLNVSVSDEPRPSLVGMERSQTHGSSPLGNATFRCEIVAKKCPPLF